MVGGDIIDVPTCDITQCSTEFLGLVCPHEASLGILLSDALRYLSTGAWWLAMFPGIALVGLVLLFDQFAKAVQQLWLRSD